MTNPMTVLALLFSMVALASPSAARPPQTLVVTADGWDVDRGRLTLIEGDRVIFGPVSVHLGRSGLAWGLGLHRPPARAEGPSKREGDGRSPAGVFTVGARYDRADSADAYCVDDPASDQYNAIVTLPPGARPSWSSAERMRDYRVAVVITHNAGRVAGRGSCIFLHESDRPTAGCTALAREDLDRLLTLLAPGARVVQLPAASYRALVGPWKLPPPTLVGLSSPDDPHE
ncbi:MAG: hypothetical protein EP329_09595 [Deltaproteobacteria bacterium]|nr:MAG: hypothetical protein EP329_09595 [Deltaproteobacteria bacterium]